MILERYIRAESIEECAVCLAEYGGDAALLAGGTDLIPKIAQGRRRASTLIDMAAVPALSQTTRDEKGVMIGAMRRLRSLQQDMLFTGPWRVLRESAGHVSSMQIRNVATIGGNICNASPAADMVPGLLILDAVARIYGKEGFREVPLSSFFAGPGQTALKAGELLAGLYVPDAPPHSGTAYRKYAIRGDSDLSIVGAGARITIDEDGRIAEARIALASVGPTPLRMTREERMLTGMRPTPELFGEAAAACAESCSPITDQRASMAYRKDMVRVWAEAALREAAGLR